MLFHVCEYSSHVECTIIRELNIHIERRSLYDSILFMKLIAWLVMYFLLHSTGENYPWYRQKLIYHFFLFMCWQTKVTLIRVIRGEAIFCGSSGGLCTHSNRSLLFSIKQLGIKAFREEQIRDMCCQTFSLVMSKIQ